MKNYNNLEVNVSIFSNSKLISTKTYTTCQDTLLVNDTYNRKLQLTNDILDSYNITTNMSVTLINRETKFKDKELVLVRNTNKQFWIVASYHTLSYEYDGIYHCVYNSSGGYTKFKQCVKYTGNESYINTNDTIPEE